MNLCEYLSDLLREPLDALLESFPCEGVAGGDVPRLVLDAFQTQSRRDLDAGQGVAHVHLVGEEQDGDSAGCDVGMLQQEMQLLPHDDEAQSVAAVHDEDDALAIPVVVLPQVPVSAMA